MRKGLLGALATLLAGASLAPAQMMPPQNPAGMIMAQNGMGGMSAGSGGPMMQGPPMSGGGSMGPAVFGNGQQMMAGANPGPSSMMGPPPGAGGTPMMMGGQPGTMGGQPMMMGGQPGMMGGQPGPRGPMGGMMPGPMQGPGGPGGPMQGPGNFGGPGPMQGAYGGPGPGGPGGFGPGGPGDGYGPGPGPGPGGYGPGPGPNGPNPYARPNNPNEVGRYWFKMDYLYWWVPKQNLPALLTTGSTTDSIPGALGEPGTSVILGDHSIGDNYRQGGRFEGGVWCDCDHTFGFDASFFFLGEATSNFAAAGSAAPGTQVLARPFFNILTPVPTSTVEYVAFPGLSSGTVTFSSSSKFYGADLNAVCNWFEDGKCRIDWLAGFAYDRLDESLNIADTSQLVNGNAFASHDTFSGQTNFYGAQFGGRIEYRYKILVMQFTSKTGLGVSQETVDITGRTILQPAKAAPVITQSGLLALRSNIGNYDRTKFAAAGDTDLNLGVQVKNWCRLYVGSSLFYWSNVVRPADQIDLHLNRTFIPSFTPTTAAGPNSPVNPMKETGFWAAGIYGGVELKY